MNAPVAVPLGFISNFANDVENSLTSMLQEFKRKVKDKVKEYTVPGHHDGRPIYPKYIRSLAEKLSINLDNPQEIEAQRVDEFREKLEDQKNALKDWSALLKNIVGLEFPLIVNENEGREGHDLLLRINRDLDELLSDMNQENEQLKNIIIDFSFSMFTADYFKSQVQRHFSNSENFFKRQFEEKIKTEFKPPSIQGYDMQEMRPRTYDELPRFEQPFNVVQGFIKEIRAKRGLEGKIQIMNQKKEEMSQDLETVRENLRNLNLDHQQLQQALKDAEKAKESALLRSIRSLVLTNVTSIISMLILRC